MEEGRNPLPTKLTPLNIKDAEVYRLARQLAEQTGQSMTETVRQALRERLAREENRRPDPVMLEKLLEISERCAARPVLDPRSDEEIVGYDQRGLPV
jgi:antitoxin VapB